MIGGNTRSINNPVRTAGIVIAASAVLGCSDGLGPNPEGRFIVNNNQAELSLRVHAIEAGVPLPISVDRLPNFTSAPPDADVQLTLRAQVDPPVVDGITLQATHVDFSHPKVYVSYNVQGPVRMGGIDVFFNPKPKELELWSQGIFLDTDVSAVDWAEGDVLYLATGTSSEGFETPAVLEEIELDFHRLTENVRRVDVPSFAGTGVKVVGDRVYVTSGTGGDPVGGLSVFDRASLGLLYFDAFADARGVDAWDGTIVAMHGTPAGIRVYSDLPELQASHEVGGATVPESKSTVRVANDLAFVAAGEEGLKVVSLIDGSVVQHIPVPTVDGVAPEMAVTNGVSVSGDLVFAANGGAGLFVYRASVDLEETATVDPQLILLGQVQFPDGGSANFVWCAGDLIYVADGAGGLRVVQLQNARKSVVSP
jgi:hypothetical protein